MTEAKLLAAADQVDVMEVAGRIIGHPCRHGPSATTAETVALAHAVERFWEVAIEADLLVRALRLPQETDHETDAAEHAIASQADRISKLMAAIRGETPKEEIDASSHS